MYPSGVAGRPINPHGQAHALAGRWVPISSSWIASILWLATGDLDVRTHKGTTLHYGGCDVATFEAFLAADSKGTFLNTVLKQQLSYKGSTP